MFRGSLPPNAAMNDQQGDAEYDINVPVQPIDTAAWRGWFKIPSLNLDINIAAHVSNKACFKVLEVARTMTESLYLEMFQRHDVWPASFKSSPPTEHSVALLFFSKGRDEELLYNLLTHAVFNDIAFKSVIGKDELLIFTSLHLPEKLRRFQGKHYFWGVFNGKQAPSSHLSDSHIHTQTIRATQSLSPSGSYRSFEGKGSPKTISNKNNPFTQACKTEKRGRRLDDAWEHAKPLDVLRQKAQCRYCGFVSSHGGISRLKAHLGGGHPSIRIPGCDKVSPEVKKVMADWFCEWVKKTKALWTKEIKVEPGAHIEEKGGLLDKHAKPLDVSSQETDCKYFRSELLYERISHHKVHLVGEDPKSQTEAWPKVSDETKVDMSRETGAKKARVAGMLRGRPLDDAWLHAKPLDEARQKTRCNYCDFVSMYGGISRLKAHLGGGCPEMQLQGCPLVPPEVKRVMEQWFNKWAKNSTATWTKKYHASNKPPKRGRPLDDTWDHAIALDETRQAAKCKYCGFVSYHGGIARLKAHLVGGDPLTQLEGCPNLSPEVKKLIAGGTKKHMKKSKGARIETVGEVQEMGRTGDVQWSEKRHHVLEETLGEISNTSLKGSLQKLINEKNSKLQKMRFEINSLESQLASMH